ncbi:MAG: hypothetical protein ACI32N_08875 [Bulleidia sp.]
MEKKWICSVIWIGLLAGCQSTPESQSSTANPLAGYSELPEDNRYRIYEKNDLKTFMANGSGVVMLAQQDDADCANAVYVVNDLLETYEMQAGYYSVEDVHDSEIVQWIRDSVQDVSVWQSDEIEEPLVLFVEQGTVVSAYDDEWFEEHTGNVAELMDDMYFMQKYLEDRNVDACDDGCTLGG